MLKKMIFVFSIGFAVTAITGCDDDDKDSSSSDSICQKWLSDVIQMDKLSANQQGEVYKTFVTSCEKYFNDMPVCRKETTDYANCMVSTPRSYFSEQKDLEEKCREENHDEAAADACIDKLFQKCRSQESNIRQCNSQNESSVEAYYHTAENPVKVLHEKLESMGLDPDDYYDPNSLFSEGFEY